MTKQLAVMPVRASVRKETSENIADRVYQSTLMRALSRYWRSELSDREYTMLAYIMDHTVEWGRLAYRFTYKSLAEGTSISPCGLSKGEQQLRETLLLLERKEAISVTRGRDGLAITFNPQWRPIKSARKRSMDAETPLEIQGVAPRKSKGQTLGFPYPLLEEHSEQQGRRALQSADADRPPGSFLKDCSNSETNIVSIVVRKRIRPVRPENPNAETTKPTEVGELSGGAAVTKAEARRQARDGHSLYGTWQEAYDATYAEVPGAACVAWSKAEMAMAVTQLAKPFKGTPPELHDFVGWVVRNWPVVMVDEFDWMRRKRPPELPSLRFMLAFKDKFFAAYGRRSVDRYLASLSDHERALRKGLLRDGLTAQQVIARLAERSARLQLREEIEKGREEVAWERRRVGVERANVNAERRELLRMGLRAQQARTETRPILADGAREITDEQMAENLKLIAKMMEVDPNGE